MFPIRDHNPAERTPYVTYALIASNITIWLYGLAFVNTDAQLSALYYDYAMIPARFHVGENYLGMFTSLFLHAGFMHLAGNMLFLWIFGDNLEDKMGHVRFFVFYIISGAGAAYAQYIIDVWSPVPMVGASGAIAGVMGGYLLLFPKAKVDIFLFLIIFIRIFPIPAWVMLGIWFGLQLFNGIGASTVGGGVAYWAHTGGFVIGLILTIPLWLSNGGPGFWDRTKGHPDHPEARYTFIRSRVPKVTRK